MPIIRIKSCISKGPCNGQSHEWEFRKPLLSESRVILAKTGLKGSEQFLNAITEDDPEAWTALLDILHRRSGIGLRWEDIDLDIEEIDVQFTAEEQADFDAEQAALAADGGDSGKADGPAYPPSQTSGIATAEDLTPRYPTTPPASGNTSVSPP